MVYTVSTDDPAVCFVMTGVNRTSRSF